MIRNRLFYVGTLLTALGWQTAAGLIDDPSFGPAMAMWVVGVIIILFAVRTARGEIAAAVLIGQGLLLPPLIAFLARVHELPGLAELLALIARLFGVEADAVAGRVVIQTGGAVVDYVPSLSRLEAFPLLAIVGAFAAVALLVPVAAPWRWLGRTAATLGAFAFLRVLLIMVARGDLPEHGLETSVTLAFITLLPAALFLPAATSLASAPVGSRRLRLTASFVAGFACAIAVGFVDVGVRKDGRVLFDDSHGPWEPTDTPFDTVSYGRLNSYSYSSMYRLIGWYYPVSRMQTGPITPVTLATSDVLIVKTPTRPFTSGEIESIEQFVLRGGGLVLIGDHTNLFGMTTHLNRLAKRFGIEFGIDDTFAVVTETQSHWRSPRWMPHPIARHIGAFEFETSCTLDVPFTARAPMIGHGLGADIADYSRPGFFGNLHLDDRDLYGSFVQHAVLDYGRGRVAALADSTPLSNFSIFFPGRRELVLATVEFVNRRGTVWRFVPLVALLALVAAIVLLARHRMTGGVPAAIVIAAGFVSGALLVRAVVHMDLPRIRESVPMIVFDRSIGRARIPSVLDVNSPHDDVAIDTFVVAAQRLGYMPLVAEDLTAARGDAMVIVQPGEVSAEQLTALRRFVSRGGSLLIVDGLLERGTGTGALLEAFGMALQTASQRTNVKSTGTNVTLSLVRPLLTVAGGEPVLNDDDGRVVYSERRFGQGRVSVLVDAFAVSKTALGSRFTGTPTAEQRASLDLAYFVLRRTVEGPVKAAQTPGS